MTRYLKENRIKLNKDLGTIEKRKNFSPSILGLYKILIPLLGKHVKGVTLDIGCGDMPFKKNILDKTDSYEGLDIKKRNPDTKYIGDVQDMNMIKNDSMDTVLLFQVLEHVKNPEKALKEIYRILKTDGKLIISVPHLSRLHEIPHDYFRYTKYGLRHRLEKSGFEILELKEYGGFFSFIGHQLSSFFVLLFWRIPIIKQISFFLNKWLVVKSCYFLDKITDKKKMFALGYVAVVQKI